MAVFKSGDRITLTGSNWGEFGDYPTGRVVTISEVGEDGTFQFVDGQGHWWDVNYPGWEIEINRDTPLEHFEKLAQVGEQLGISSFEQNVRRILNDIGDMLVEKNKAYSNSALNPINVFSKADRTEQIRTRIDDKLNRIRNGHEYPGDDTVNDLIGYLVILKIAEES